MESGFGNAWSSSQIPTLTGLLLGLTHMDKRDLATFAGFGCLYLHCDLKQSSVVSVTKSRLNEDSLWGNSRQCATGLLM